MRREPTSFGPTFQAGLALFAALPVIPLAVWSACRVAAAVLTVVK